MRLIVMNRIIDLKHHLRLLCFVPSYLPFLLARKFNYVSVGLFSINDLVKLMISCSSFSSFCFLFAFPFWLDTLVTLFEFRILHAGLLYQRKALSYCCSLRTPYWQLRKQYARPFPVALFNLVSTNPTDSFLSQAELFRACEKDTLYFRSLLVPLWFIKSAMFSKMFAVATNFWFLKINFFFKILSEDIMSITSLIIAFHRINFSWPYLASIFFPSVPKIKQQVNK